MTRAPVCELEFLPRGCHSNLDVLLPLLKDDDISTPDFATGTLDATSTHPSGSFRKLSYGFAIPKRDLRFFPKEIVAATFPYFVLFGISVIFRQT